MAARDDGEFELILGNKQLLSVLFIVIVLLGVFFAMGFLAGRSTSSTVAVKQEADQVPISVDAATTPSAAPRTEAPVVEPAPVETAKAEPAKEEPKPAETKPAEPKKAETKPAETKKEEPKKAEPKAAPKAEAARGGFVAAPPAGTYLQVAATRRADAESMLSYLSGKTGLKGYVTPSPKSPELFRVLLGPLTNEQVAKARTDLAGIGVANPLVQKY